MLEDFVLRRPGAARCSFLSRKDTAGLTKVQRARNRDLIDAWLRLNERLNNHVADADAMKALIDLEKGLIERVTLVAPDFKDLDDAFLYLRR